MLWMVNLSHRKVIYVVKCCMYYACTGLLQVGMLAYTVEQIHIVVHTQSTYTEF